MSDALTEALAQLEAEATERRQQPQAAPPQPSASPRQDGANEGQPERPGNRGPFSFLRLPNRLDTRGTLLGSIVHDVARGDGVVSNPALRGAARGINETLDLGAELGTAAGDLLSQNVPATRPALIQFSRFADRLGFSRNEAPDVLPSGRPEDADLTDRLVEGVSQFATGWFIGGRALRMAGVGRARTLGGGFLRSTAQGAIGDFVAFDGNDERLSNLVESVPQLRNPVTQFLAADADDDELTGRLKNVLEGLGAGALIETFMITLRGTRALMRGNKKGVEEASEALEREVGARRTGAETAQQQRAAAQQAEAEAAAQAPQPNAIQAAINAVRERLGLGARSSKPLDEAAELAQLKRDAGDRAAEGITDPAQQASARTAAEQAAEAEYRRLRQTAQPEGSAGSSQSQGQEGAARRPNGPQAGAPDIPEGVLSSRDDVEALLREAEFNKDFTGELNIKPDSEATLTRQHGEWTLDTIGSAEKLDATLRALVERTNGRTVRTDADLQASTLRAADELGQTAEDTLAVGAHIAGIAGDMDKAVNLMRVMWKRTVQEVDSHIGRDIQNASPEEFANVVRSIHNALTFSNYMARVKSAMGRGLRVFQLPDADTYARIVAEGDPTDALRAQDGRSVPPLPRDPQEVSDWLELWGLTRDNPQARSDMLEGLQALPDQWKYLRNSFANLFTANVLSGVPSIMLNVVGPATIGALRTIEKTTGAGMLALNPFISAAERSRHLSVARNAMVAYTQAMGDIRAVFNYARQAVEEGRSILGGGGSVSDRAAQFGPITEGMLRATGQQNGPGYWAGNVVNMWPSVFSRVNNGLDEFSKRLSFLGEVRARALVEGGEQGLQGQQLAEFVAQRVRGSIDETGAAADEAMLEAAERTTFTGSPGAEGSKARQISNLINDWRANTPEIRYVLPIFNVPANALGETLTRIPIVNFALKETREALLGNRGAIEQAEAHGRMLLGASMLTAGFFLARSGQITGAGPQDPTDRAAWGRTHQPYSIRIGDQWVDYSRYDILGSLLGIPATVFDETVYRRQDMDAFKTMVASAAALSQFFRDRAALQTVSDLLSFGEGGQSPETFVERLTGGTAGRMLMPNWVTQLGRHIAGDDTARTKTQAFQYMMDLIPFVSGSLDPQRNVWGEPIHRPKDSFFENLAPITMTPASVYENDPQTDELERLYSATGYAPGVTQQDDISGGFYDAREVELEDGHSLYDAIIRARTSVQIDGLTLRQAALELFNSDDYNEAVDADASNRTTSNGDVSRGYLISRVFRDYNEAARQQVAQESDIAARYLAATAAKRTDDALLRNYSAEQLVGTRGLAEALGIDLDEYIARARGE